MTKFKEWNLGSNVDVLVGGTPCQSFSVAGLRKGLDDPRGNLMLTYLAIAKQYRPNWLVWENVPGVLSSNGGLDFASFFRGMGELGYGFAYRVLDAQYFGVAQRRRRVFVVGYLGDWRAAAAVLFERHSLQGHPAPSREKRQDPPASIGTGAIYGGSDINTADTVTSKWAKGSGGPAGNECGLFVAQPIVVDRAAFNQGENAQYKFRAEHSETMDSLVARGPHAVLQPAYGIPGNWIGRKPENGGNATEPMYDVAPCLTKADQHGVAQPIAYNISPGKGALKEDIHVTDAYATKTLDASASNPAMHQGGTAIVQPICLMDQGGSVMSIEHDITGTLRRETHGHEPIVMQPVGTNIYNGAITGDVAVPLTNRSDGTGTGPTVMQSMAVRRLTPVECERLQGFGDNYTNIKSKGKPTPDGPRYKALGNSMAVPVMAWIGARIQQYEDM